MAQQPRSAVVPEQVMLHTLANRLEPAPRVQVDHVRKRRKPLATGLVIVAGQPLGSVGIVLELHPLRAITRQDRLLAGSARRAAPSAAIRKLVIEKHAILRACYRPHSPWPRLPRSKGRGGTPAPDNYASRLLFQPRQRSGTGKHSGMSKLYKEDQHHG